MGRYYANKCLLMDEQDFSRPFGEDFDLFARDLEAECAEQIRCEVPYLQYQFLGCTSERFDRTSIRSDAAARPFYLAAGWEPTLTRICREGGLRKEDCQVWQASDRLFEHRFRRHVIQDIERGYYARAKKLCRFLEEFQTSELPCFRRQRSLLASAEDAAIDYRQRLRFPGKRILIEIAIRQE